MSRTASSTVDGATTFAVLESGTTTYRSGVHKVLSATGPTTVNPAVGTLVKADCSAGNVTVNMPAASAGIGAQVLVKMTSDAGSVLINGGASTIDGNASLTLDEPKEWALLVSDGTNYHQVG